MSKRPMQEKKAGEERVMAKSKPTMSLVLRSVNRYPTLDSVYHGTRKPIAQNVKHVNENTATSSQVWHQNEKHAYRHRETDSAHFKSTHRNKIDPSQFPDLRRPIPRGSLSECTTKNESSRKKQMLDLEVDGIIWRIFMSATMKAAIHLGPTYQQNLCTAKNTDFEPLRSLFDISQSLILTHESEICGTSSIEWHHTLWRRSILLHDRSIELSKAKLNVWSDSVLCLGKMHEHPTGVEKLKERKGWFFGSKHHQEFFGIDGEPLELDWNIFPRHTTVELLKEIQKIITTRGSKPEEFKNMIIFMSMYNDIDWTKSEEIFIECFSNYLRP